jgi:hypothetical protein
MNAKQIIASVFAQASIQAIAYNTAWENGTGYFDKAVKGQVAPVLEIGQMVKSESTGGRKIVMVGTQLGNVVVFERYTDVESDVVVGNMPRCIEQIAEAHGALSADKIAYLLGLLVGKDMVYSFDGSNIGHFVSNLLKFAKKLEQAEELATI